MKHDPSTHHRRSIRLKNYDYSQAGAYFVTLCTFRRLCLFGEIVNGEMQLNDFGKIVENVWQSLPNHHPRVQLDSYVIMPNHFHGILFLLPHGRGEASASTLPASSTSPDADASPLQPHGTNPALSNPPGADASPLHPIGTQPGSISAVIQNFKSVSSRRLNNVRGVSQPPIWQRNFHEHILRNDRNLAATRLYIQNNPLQWALDKENPQNSVG